MLPKTQPAGSGTTEPLTWMRYGSPENGPFQVTPPSLLLVNEPRLPGPLVVVDSVQFQLTLPVPSLELPARTNQ